MRSLYRYSLEELEAEPNVLCGVDCSAYPIFSNARVLRAAAFGVHHRVRDVPREDPEIPRARPHRQEAEARRAGGGLRLRAQQQAPGVLRLGWRWR